MEEIITQTSLICSGIVLITILITVSALRFLANLFIIVIFGTAVLSPLGINYFVQLSSLAIDTNLLYLYSFGIGAICTLITVPLWGISSIMNFTDKSQVKKIQKEIKDLDKD